ncbi:MAG: hypothetical protein E7493_09700 [Ruminococcus albus]|nr:hypothetical protein [Ruminococcus albus]
MVQAAVPHLCGGILFDLLLEAKKPRRKSRNKFKGGSDGLTIPGLYAGLIEIVTGEDLSGSAGDTLSKCATNYRKCEDSTGDYVPFTKVATQAAFKSSYEINRYRLYERMAKFIGKYLNKDKCVWLVSALIETMQNDVDIDDDMPIAISFTETLPVKQLHKADKIVLLPFLLNILSYVIEVCPDCESGKDTFLAWYSHSGSRSEWKFNNNNLGSSIPAIEVDTGITYPSPTTSASDSVADIDDDVKTSVEVNTEADASEGLSDREVINNRILEIRKIMAATFGAVEHQMAEEIRQGQKKKIPPTEEPETKKIEAEIVDDDQPAKNPEPSVTIVQNQTNIEHDESKTFNIKDSNVTFNL